MKIELVCQRSDGTVTSLELSSRPITIGSGDAVDLQVLGPEISPRHCALRSYQGACVLKDLESKTGTFVNGKRVDLVRLRTGDRIRIGGIIFTMAQAQPDKGTTTLMEEAAEELDRGKEQGKGLRTMLGEIVGKGKGTTRK